MARDYKIIRAWQDAKAFIVEVYRQTKKFPTEETYGIVSQLRRAAISVSSNIAEGASRQHKKDYLNFLYIAKASLSEAESLLIVSNEVGCLGSDDYGSLDKLCQGAARTLYGLIQSVESEI